jgi:hypothetical protein
MIYKLLRGKAPLRTILARKFRQDVSLRFTRLSNARFKRFFPSQTLQLTRLKRTEKVLQRGCLRDKSFDMVGDLESRPTFVEAIFEKSILMVNEQTYMLLQV